ncbi:MAG: oxidoreductase [Nitrospinae bacterium RIFCSPLOWO2_12_FULL_47_7]|nr:MAG: oxidoreductase [Nitrospinae bacterium RIFCSPLOWO2_12_FULL_47_7]
MSLIKAGVVGVGKMGEYHVGVLSELPEVELVGIADVNKQHAEAMGKKYNVPWFTKAEDLFGSVDIAIVAVPTGLHYSITKKFLSSGIHVLLEKPCAHNLKDAEELFNLAARKNLILHIGHVERFNGAVQELHKIVTAPLFVECKRMGPYSERIKDDGVVLDVMIHDIDIVLNLIQSKVVRTHVVGTSVFSGRDDIVSAQLEFENSCIANILASRVSQNKERTLSVTQKDSFVLLDYTEQEIYVHRQSSSENVMRKGFLRYKQESLVERIFVHKDNPLKLEIKHFLDCVSNGSPRKIAVDNEIYSLQIALDILEQFNKQKAKDSKIN